MFRSLVLFVLSLFTASCCVSFSDYRETYIELLDARKALYDSEVEKFHYRDVRFLDLLVPVYFHSDIYGAGVYTYHESSQDQGEGHGLVKLNLGPTRDDVIITVSIREMKDPYRETHVCV